MLRYRFADNIRPYSGMGRKTKSSFLQCKVWESSTYANQILEKFALSYKKVIDLLFEKKNATRYDKDFVQSLVRAIESVDSLQIELWFKTLVFLVMEIKLCQNILYIRHSHEEYNGIHFLKKTGFLLRVFTFP